MKLSTERAEPTQTCLVKRKGASISCRYNSCLQITIGKHCLIRLEQWKGQGCFRTMHDMERNPVGIIRWVKWETGKKLDLTKTEEKKHFTPREIGKELHLKMKTGKEI